MFAVLSPVRKFLRPLAAGLAALALSACDPSMLGGIAGPGASVGPSIQPGQPVQVALLVPKSDPSVQGLGQQLENAARMAVAANPGANIQLKVYDTAGSETTAAAQAQRAVDEGAKIVLGPLFSGTSLAASEQLVDDGINVLSFSNTTSVARASDNLFILGPTFENTANRLLGYARKQGRKSVVIVHPDDTPGNIARQAIETAATTHGMVASAQGYPLTIEAVTTTAQNAGRMVASGAADSVFITADATNAATPMLLRLLPENGATSDKTQFIGLTRWDVRPDLFELPGAEGAVFALPNREQQARFDSAYQAAHGSAPNPLASLGYDGVSAVAQLIGSGRSDALTGKALRRTTGFQGTGGMFRFLPDGTNQRALAVATIRNRQVVVIEPAPSGFGGAGF